MTLAQEIIDRLKHYTGTISPGAINLAADIVALCAAEAIPWTSRWDDATRIPEMLHDAERELRQKARNAST